MEPLIIALTVVSSILAIFLIALGIQIFLILREVRDTLSRVNRLADTIEHSALKALAPLSSMGDFVSGVKGGMKVLDAFVGYLKRSNTRSRSGDGEEIFEDSDVL